MKPYRTLRQLLVHPKDQRTAEQTGECVYRIPCYNCDCTYIGETGRNYGKRQEEYRKEVESISNRTFTRSDRKSSAAAEMNKSAITDHVAKENHVIISQVPKFWKEKDIGKPDRSRSRSGSGKNPTA